VLVLAGESRSEGGFAPNKVSVASLLDVQQAKDKKGKSYYKYEILTRTGNLRTPLCCIVTVPHEIDDPEVDKLKRDQY
jgi:hypothetical protein